MRFLRGDSTIYTGGELSCATVCPEPRQDGGSCEAIFPVLDGRDEFATNVNERVTSREVGVWISQKRRKTKRKKQKPLHEPVISLECHAISYRRIEKRNRQLVSPSMQVPCGQDVQLLCVPCNECRVQAW